MALFLLGAAAGALVAAVIATVIVFSLAEKKVRSLFNSMF